MNQKTCNKCRNIVMQTVRICPKCGSREFDLDNTILVTDHNEKNTKEFTNHSNDNSVQIRAGNRVDSNINTAPLLSRLVAYIIDTVIIAVIGTMLVFISFLLVLPTRSQDGGLASSIIMFVAYIIPFVYFTLLHSSEKQATYGKKIMKIKLISMNGQKITKLQAFLRVFTASAIPIGAILILTILFTGSIYKYDDVMAGSSTTAYAIGILCSIFGPYLLVLFNNRRQTLFDMIVKTIVVKD